MTSLHVIIALSAAALGLLLPVVESLRSTSPLPLERNLRVQNAEIMLSVAERAEGTLHAPDAEDAQGQLVRGEKVIVTQAHNTSGDVTVVPVPKPQSVPGEEIKLTAKAAAVLDVESGNILFNKSADESVPIASITKLFTALVVLEREPAWNQLVTMTAADEAPSGGTSVLYRGEQVTVHDLWQVMLVHSDNNAARALARSTGMSEEAFVAAMNEYAQRLDLTQTALVEPTGLRVGNVSTPREVAHAFAYALEYESIRSALTMREYIVRTRAGRTKTIKNTDRLLFARDVNVIGGKTGSTDAAGYCLVAAVQGARDQHIIIAVFGTASDDARFNEAKKLSEWTWAHWKWPSEEEAAR